MEYHSQTESDRQPMSNKRLISILASPLWFPAALAGICLFGVFLGCGWLFVAMTFFTAAAAVAAGIIGIAGAYMNLVNGYPAALIYLAIGLTALGSATPIFLIAREFFRGFRVVSDELIIKGKSLIQKKKERKEE